MIKKLKIKKKEKAKGGGGYGKEEWLMSLSGFSFFPLSINPFDGRKASPAIHRLHFLLLQALSFLPPPRLPFSLLLHSFSSSLPRPAPTDFPPSPRLEGPTLPSPTTTASTKTQKQTKTETKIHAAAAATAISTATVAPPPAAAVAVRNPGAEDREIRPPPRRPFQG